MKRTTTPVRSRSRAKSLTKAGLQAATLAAALCPAALSAQTAAEPSQSESPMSLAKDGFFYVGGKYETVDGHRYVTGQMYVEYRVPSNQTHPYPIIMVHGGTRTGTTYTGTPDGREGWAQYFVRQGYAVYVVDQPGRGRSGYLDKTYGPQRHADAQSAEKRYLREEDAKLWPQAHLHTQWPGTGKPDDPVTMAMVASFVPEIQDFNKQQVLNRDALIALLEKIGPSVIMVHSQAGAFVWPVADAKPDLVKGIVAVEPNGPPVHGVKFVGAPKWFEYGKVTLPYGLTAVPLTYDPPVKDASELKFVQQEEADGEGLVRCYAQVEPARQLPNLKKMPILLVSSEASYHAPYDHCTVKYLEQAGVNPTFMKLADLGIRGNSHVMMQEKNSKDIAAAMAGWLAKAVTAPAQKHADRETK